MTTVPGSRRPSCFIFCLVHISSCCRDTDVSLQQADVSKQSPFHSEYSLASLASFLTSQDCWQAELERQTLPRCYGNCLQRPWSLFLKDGVGGERWLFTARQLSPCFAVWDLQQNKRSTVVSGWQRASISQLTLLPQNKTPCCLWRHEVIPLWWRGTYSV